MSHIKGLGLVLLLGACSSQGADGMSTNTQGSGGFFAAQAGATAGAAGVGTGGAAGSASMLAGSGGVGAVAGADAIGPEPDGGAGISGGTGSAAGGGGDTPIDAAVAEPAPCVKGTVTGSQVIFIGDSFLAAPTSNIAFELEALMQASGSTAYSETPRFRQLVGTTMEQIVAQYDTEKELDPDIKVVIANGGGNDVLVTDRSCLTQAPPENAGCAATVANALRIAGELLAKAEADGVEHYVYFFYPHEPTFGLFQGDAPTINASLEYAEPMARAVCESSPICTFVSLSEAAGDTPGSGYTERGLINEGDVHPSPEGSRFFAEAIWAAMVERCIAQ